MIEYGLQNLDAVLLVFCGVAALASAVLMLVLRHPMRVALALVATMLSLAGVYAMLGAHAVAVFQILIYVGAVMVFMVYVIMLLDVRDTTAEIAILEARGDQRHRAQVLAQQFFLAVGTRDRGER